MSAPLATPIPTGGYPGQTAFMFPTTPNMMTTMPLMSPVGTTPGAVPTTVGGQRMLMEPIAQPPRPPVITEPIAGNRPYGTVPNLGASPQSLSGVPQYGAAPSTMGAMPSSFQSPGMEHASPPPRSHPGAAAGPADDDEDEGHGTHIAFKKEVRTVDKRVEIPQYNTRETEEVKHMTLVRQKVNIRDEEHEIEVVEEEGVPAYETVTKEVAKPIYEPNLVEHPVDCPLVEEVIVEVKVPNPVNLLHQVVKTIEQVHAKTVTVPVVRLEEELCPVPVDVKREQMSVNWVEEVLEFEREVPGPESSEISKKEVHNPIWQIEHKEEEVDLVTLIEEPDEVEEVQIVEVIKQVLKPQVVKIEKRVPKIEVQYVEKIVEVPQIIYEQRVIEEPVIEIRELVRKVPVPVTQVQTVELPHYNFREVRKVVQYPQELKHEMPVPKQVEVPVELVIEEPIPDWQPVPKDIPRRVLNVVENSQNVPVSLVEERIAEVEQEFEVEIVREVIDPQYQYVDKVVPVVETHVQEVIVNVPQDLVVEQPVHVPEVHEVSQLQEQVQEYHQVVQKQVPQVHVNYVTKVDNVHLTPLGVPMAMPVATSVVPMTPVPVGTAVPYPGMEHALPPHMMHPGLAHGLVHAPLMTVPGMEHSAPPPHMFHAGLAASPVPGMEHSAPPPHMFHPGLAASPVPGMEHSAPPPHMFHPGLRAAAPAEPSMPHEPAMMMTQHYPGMYAPGAMVATSPLGVHPGLVPVPTAGVVPTGIVPINTGMVPVGVPAGFGPGMKAGSITDDVFNIIDQDHDGLISRQEFRGAMKGNIISASPVIRQALGR